MAAPMRDRTGGVWAGVAIQGPTDRLTDARLAELAPLLLRTVSEMETAGA
jgi:DNA-binding IclR family transcriptional regulator